MLSEEELNTIVEAEEKRLGVGSKEFMQCHNDIMRMAGKARQNGGKPDGADGADGNAQGSV